MLYDKKWDEKLPVNNFKSAAELGISEKVHAALQQVLQMLESGEIVEKERGPGKYVWKQNDPKVLWMATYKDNTACGTAACIGGWAAILMGINSRQHVWEQKRARGPLHHLYWGHVWPTTPQQAAQAVRNFLVTGNPNWDAVLRI